MVNVTSGFDSIWQQYQRNEISVHEFLQRAEISGFAAWAQAKILQEKERSPIQPLSLKSLADALSEIDPEASSKIRNLFVRVQRQLYFADNEQERELQQAAPLLQGIRSHVQRVLNALRAIPPEKREGVIQQTAPLVHGITSGNEVVTILNSVMSLPEDEREDVILKATPLLQGLTTTGRRAILLAVKDIAPELRAAVTQGAAPLVQRFNNADQRIFIVRGLAVFLPQISEDDRGDFLQALGTLSTERIATLFSQDLRSAYRFSQAMQQMLRIEPAYEYQIHVVPSELENNPIALLDTLVTQFIHQVRTVLNVHFEGEAGIDAGGLGRQFISDLFSFTLKAVKCKKDLDSGLYRPILEAKEQPKVFRQLGQVMMFCLNADREYPIGILIDEAVFIALKEFTNADLEREFQALSFDQLFRVYEAMNSATDAGKKKIESIKALPREAKEDIANDYLRPELAPIFEMAKGMKSAPFTNKCPWQAVRQMAPSALSRGLQGTLSREALQDKLKFDESIPQEKRQWIQRWIATADMEKIKQFLYTLTGATSIGSMQLKINDNSGSEQAALFFHTCFNAVEIPFASIDSEAKFKEVFEATLGGTKKYNRA